MQLLIQQGDIRTAVAASRLVPELKDPYPAAEYEKRLSGVPHLILIATARGQLAGFKVGYEREGYFYSWMGGVVPEFRRTGVAQALANAQESWAREQGYRSVTFKTLNRHKAMLTFALNNGFYLTRVETRKDPMDNRVWLHKVLS